MINKRKLGLVFVFAILGLLLNFSIVYSFGDGGSSGGDGDGGGSGGDGDGGNSGGDGDAGNSGGDGDAGNSGSSSTPGPDAWGRAYGSADYGIPPNTAPTFTSSPVTTATEDLQYQYNIGYTDNEGDASLSLTTGPSTMVLVGNTLVWTPVDNESDQQHSVVLTLSDAEFTNTQSFSINAIRVNDEPTLSTLPNQNVDEDTGLLNNIIDLWNYVFDEETSIVDLVFSIFQDDSSIVDCSVDSNRYVDCSTVENANGVATVNVSVTDEGNLTATQSFTTTVNPVNDAPEVTLSVLGTVTEGKEFTLELDINDIEGDSMNYVIEFGDGEVVNERGVSSGVYTLTHTYYKPGTYTITTIVTDSNGATITKTLIVNVQEEESDKVLVRNSLRVNSIYFRNVLVQEGDVVEAFVNVENLQDFEIENVKLRASIPELGVVSRASVLPIEGESKVAKVMMLRLPSNVEPGRYGVNFLVEHDGDRATIYRWLEVSE